MRNAIFRFLVSFFCGTITCSALAVSPAPLVRWLNERQSEPAAATPVLQAERRWKLCAPLSQSERRLLALHQLWHGAGSPTHQCDAEDI